VLVVRVVMLSVACVARLTVNVKVCVVDPVALVAVTVYEVALATVVGVPVSAPVNVLKLIPAGVALIAKLAIAPPVELILNPVAAVLTVLVSDDDESVKAGAATDSVSVIVIVALLYLAASVGVKVAVIKVVPAEPSVIVVPEMVAVAVVADV